MSPRRFLLTLDHGEELPVREDIITAGDVDVVAWWLAKWRFGSYNGQARELLALVLGSDRE